MSWLGRLTQGLRKTADALGEVFTTRRLDDAALEAMEEQLILTDMGLPAAQAIVAEMRRTRVDTDVTEQEIRHLLARAITHRLERFAVPLTLDAAQGVPMVVLVVGVNGNGKTTTIGKLAYDYTKAGTKVMMVAADTFRAAAVEQLQRWSERAGCGFVRGAEGADPASVAYAGVEQAIAQGVQLVFIDTAGRLHTKENLMAELAKITKVIQKLIPHAPHAVLQVIDATTGQNALAQVKSFHATAGVTGLIVTKLDGTAKAGIVVALADQCKLPIHAIGVGEAAEDLQPFVAEEFARALVGSR